MTLYTASRPVPLVAQWLCWLVARAGAARCVPGERTTWDWPVDDDVAGELLLQWRQLMGVTRIADMAIYERPQRHRTGLTALLSSGKKTMLVRVRPTAAEVALERQVSAAAESCGVDTFRVPQLRGRGSAGDSEGAWHWTGYEVIGRAPHAPARCVTGELLAQVRDLVESVLPRPSGTDPSWHGAHGDLTPWNLRRTPGGQRWLIDWEDVRYAPRGADACYFALSRSAISRGPRKSELQFLTSHPDALEFWIETLTRRTTDARDVGLVERMISLARRVLDGAGS